jgi:hypothetical protein
MIKYLDLLVANETIKTTDIKGKDYAEVNERIKVFRMLCPNGAIETELLSNNDGMVIMKATIKDEKGNILGTGTAYERENSSFINKTSYIENCETSAVGRALGMLGIGIDTSVASYEEIANAIQNQEVTKEEAEEYVIDFGKYKGKTIKEVYEKDKQYIEWMLGNTNNDRIIKIIELTTGMKIPSPEEQKQRIEMISIILSLSEEVNVDIEEICNKFNVNDLGEMTTEQLNKCYVALKKKKEE